jgi:hypothetical protein
MKRTAEEIEASLRDPLFKQAFGKAWQQVKNCQFFQKHYFCTEKPSTVHGWDWSYDFNNWTALVEWKDGTKCWTFPVKDLNTKGLQ